MRSIIDDGVIGRIRSPQTDRRQFLLLSGALAAASAIPSVMRPAPAVAALPVGLFLLTRRNASGAGIAFGHGHTEHRSGTRRPKKLKNARCASIA
jgi:hypothetical protein